MYLHCLEGGLERKFFLDLLAFLLWNEDTPYELTDYHLHFGIKLYEEVLTEMKKETQSNGENVKVFGFMNLECREIGDICCMEKKLDLLRKLLEQRHAERF